MSHPPESTLARLARLMVRRRRLVVVGWVVVLVLAVVGGPRIAGEWSVDYETPGSDSNAVADTIKAKFPNADYDTLLLTWSAKHADSAAAEDHVTELVRRLHRIPGIGTAKVADARISDDGTIGLLPVPLTQRAANVAIDHGPAIMDIADSASTPAVNVRFGGQVITNSEQGKVSSEGVGLTVALLILLLTFGSLVAAGVPIATALFGVGTASAVVGVIASIVATPDWAES
ncbi:MAG: MMPL family transporter, partial [Patulibacter sp.]|nr:MMPL family transporter [Patulibacter sp.]